MMFIVMVAFVPLNQGLFVYAHSVNACDFRALVGMLCWYASWVCAMSEFHLQSFGSVPAMQASNPHFDQVVGRSDHFGAFSAIKITQKIGIQLKLRKGLRIQYVLVQGSYGAEIRCW